jgi:hypothetical protein
MTLAVQLLVIGRGKEVKIEKCSARASHENLQYWKEERKTEKYE